MKKVKVLLSAVAVLAVVAGAIASNARVDHKIYTESPTLANYCDVPVISRSFVADPEGNIKATLTPAPCQKGFTFEVLN